jgi:type IV pilus assembly protein PilY1
MPFRWINMNAAQQTTLNATDGLGSSRLDYLRGSRSDEVTIFRARGPNLLGDIVNSGVTYLAGSSPAYNGAKFPNHAAYRAATKNRPAVVYVGGNDGMLHAFSGTDGKELFGYIPGSVFGNLPKLSDLNFKHSYFVDSTPMVGDFQKPDDTWGTLLVGGLGAGGKGFYALDITTQSTFATATEGTLASTLPLWEFTAGQDADLGHTFNEPKSNPLTGAYQQIAKVADAANADGVWRILVGNGYGSANGKAVLFMLNANTGDAATKLSTAASAQPNGLSSPAPVDLDRDGLIDTIYAGDLLGNMHKFQFSKPDGVNFVLAKPAEAGGAWRYLGNVFASGEPITTAPTVVQSCKGIGSTVLFGTGKLNEDADYADKSNRGFYRIDDTSPSSALTVLPTELTTVSTYTSISLGANVAGRNWSVPNLSNKKGWKLVFTDGERVLTNSTLPPDSGAVLFGTTKPVGDICTPGNTGFLMAVNVCSGGIGELTYNGTVTGGIGTSTTGILKVSTSYTSSTGTTEVVTNQDECKKSGTCGLATTRTPRGRYSWREILTK